MSRNFTGLSDPLQPLVNDASRNNYNQPAMPNAIAPATLDYDTLPAESRLRREVSADGTITISLGAGEITVEQRRRAMRASAWYSAIVCAVLSVLVALFVLFQIGRGSRIDALPRGLIIALALSAGTFVIALFAFVWKIRASALLDAYARAAAQQTVVSAHVNGDTHIESRGPLGTTSATMQPCSLCA